jgi:hypothetical protein
MKGQILSLTGIFAIGFAVFSLQSGLRLTSTIPTPSFDSDRRISSFRGGGGGSFRQDKASRFALVHLLDNFTSIYEAALLCSVFRAIDIHANVPQSVFTGQLDLVVMYHGTLDITGYEHPHIRFVPFSGDSIVSALEGKGYPEWEVATHFKLAPMNLVEYDKIAFVDLDYVLRHQLASILVEATPPAMVQWGEYPQLDFNSGFHIIRPSTEMFQDAITALTKTGRYYAAIDALQDISTRGSLQKEIPHNPSQWVGYRSDQEFMYAFYESLPETRSKWGPIHPLPYRFNAREESVSFNTGRFLDRTTSHTKPKLTPPGIFDGAHLHLFGDFGQDGRGHRLNPIPKEDGDFGLIGVHFTTRKPWKEGRLHDKTLHAIRFDEELVNDTSLTPQERCPLFIYHIDFWEGVINGMMEAMNDRRYGFRWMSDELLEYVQGHILVQRCFTKEMKTLLAAKARMEQSPGKDCSDPGDCSNKHCRSRPASVSCTTTQSPSFLPLIPGS